MFDISFKNLLPSRLDDLLEALGLLKAEGVLAVVLLGTVLLDIIFKNQKWKPYLLIAWIIAGFILSFLLKMQWAQACVLGGAIIWWAIFSKSDFFVTNKYLGESWALVVAMVLGMMLLLEATHLLTVFLSIEIISVASYVLTSFAWDKKSAEGSMKYILSGAAASAITLYGISWIYGLTGTFDFSQEIFIKNLLQADPTLVLIALSFCLAGFLFKISAVPFHLWAPDVYESAPIPVTALIATLPKLATLLFMFRFFEYIHSFESIRLVLASIGVLSMTIGNLTAFWQKGLKRLLAYSSVAQVGYLLLAVAALTDFSEKSLYFYLLIYICMNVMAFALLETLYKLTGSDEIESTNGLGTKQIIVGVLVVWVMIALVGLPPTAGFTAKLLLFSAIWEKYQINKQIIWLYLFVASLINTLIALFYYLKLPYGMFLKEPKQSIGRVYGRWWYLGPAIIAMALLLFFIQPNWLLTLFS